MKKKVLHIVLIVICMTSCDWFENRKQEEFKNSLWDRSYAIDKDLAQVLAFELNIDKEDHIWISPMKTHEGENFSLGIKSFDNINWVDFSEFDSTYSKYFNPLISSRLKFDSNNNLWFGFGNKLVQYIGGNFIEYEFPRPIEGNTWIQPCYIDGNDNVWIGINSNIARFDGNEWTIYEISDAVNWYYDIQLFANTVWASTNNGIYKIEDGTVTHYAEVVTENDALSINTVGSTYEIALDKNNILYFATEQGLLVKYSDSWEILLPPDKSNGGERVSSVAIDDDNILWLGTKNGLYQLENGVWKLNEVPPSDFFGRVGEVDDVEIDRQNRKWVLVDKYEVFLFKE